MDTSTLILLIGAGAAILTAGLRPRDFWPMVINVGIIAVGTLALLWMLDNPAKNKEIQQQATVTGTHILIFLACQPLIILAGWWLSKVLGKLSGDTAIKK